ncbi:MAG: TIGR03619 family F420-dependent LLM class oxidoreductase, partial [Pseudomonadales bacterium]|nr:TIGR03619 family F420-dependent LLM class oxidoreductase [Pseudomonadales bacterium]
DPKEYCALAVAAESNGFSSIALSDHLIYPGKFSTPYPYTSDGKPRFRKHDPWPDPWIAISAMAAVTKTLRFYTNVYVLPARNPVHVAKFLSTLAVMSGNRVSLGAGMGWMPEEFAAAEQAFKQRGKRADEMLDIIRKLWTGDEITHQGEFYQLDAMSMSPVADRPLPVFIGGFSEAAMKRAAKHDGWISDLHSMAELEQLIGKMNGYRAETENTKPFQILSFATYEASDVAGFQKMRDMGVTTVCTMPWFFYGGSPASSLQEKMDAIKQFNDDFITKL